MRKTNPMIGLLRYFYYDSGGNIKIAVVFVLIMGIAALITGNFFVKNIFSLVSIAGIPYLLIMKMGGKNYPKWERFQLTMPIKRSHLIGSQYLCILLGALAGLPLVILIGTINFSIREIDYAFTIELANILATFGMPLTMAGVLYPLSSTKFGENKGEIFFLVGIAAAVGIDLLARTFIGNILEWPYELASLVSFAAAVTIFVVSYFITSKQYANMDF